MIVDACMFHNENDLFYERFNCLKEVVDKFVVVEFSKTFSGHDKKKNFDITNFSIDDRKKINYQFLPSPSPLSASRPRESGFTDPTKTLFWKHSGLPPVELKESLRREIAQRDQLFTVLKDFMSDEDVIIISDVDEIPSAWKVKEYSVNMPERVLYFEMDWRIFYTNNQCQVPWYGTYMTKFKLVKTYSIDSLRVASEKFPFGADQKISDGGMHLSYLGGKDVIKQKLTALPYQGLRAEVTKYIINNMSYLIDLMLLIGIDILFQNRKFLLKKNDEQDLPGISTQFLHKYTKAR